ncbi:FHA domain-containing protein [Microbacterium sp. NPDC055988]|uniref:FHA domain-containing protein n=1 Tax=Microbacterium sp. NPDC055988 TaxID=3345671 RepID=UPI0035DA3B7E
MQTIYRPGQWYLIVIPGALVALPPDATGETVAALWDRLPRERSLATVIDVLTTQAGGSFADMPPFVAAVLEGTDARVAVRGSLAVRVTGADAEAQTFSGADVTTWSERFVPGVSKVEITVDEGGSGSALPVQSGIVLAAAVSADIEPADAEAIAGTAGPAPVLDPASAPDSAPSVAPAPPAPVAGTSVPLPPPPGAVPAGSVPDAASDLPPAPSATAADSAADETPDAESDAETEPADADLIESTLVPGEATFAPPVDEFDHLWGATVHTPIEAAAVRPSEESETPAVDAGSATGDHDGATISAEELRSLRQSAPAAPDAPTEVIPVAAAAPVSTGRIRVSSGQVVALDRTVIIGRRPRSTRASGANLPHLIAVDSPQQDISRSHLEIRPEGDTVVVIDLHTTNGSTLLRPGADPMRLHPGEQTLVLSGDVVDLGDGVTVAFEDLP